MRYEAPMTEEKPRNILVGAALLIALSIGVIGLFVVHQDRAPTPVPASRISVKPTNTLLVAVKDLARLETNEMHFEKVIDLTDKQSRFFGLIDATDAILLVASGDVTMGVDLGKVQDADVALDPQTQIATITLPAPEIFSTRLDEKQTYVYTRSTSALAERNEQLETRARQEAVTAIEDAAKNSDSADRAKKQAERELTSLAMALGAKSVHFIWK
jgi:hypothetical protein